MANITPVTQPEEGFTLNRLWRRIKSLSFMIVVVVLVAAGFAGLHIYYPQYQDTVFHNSQQTVALPSVNSTFFFNIFLYHPVNFTFTMPSNGSLKYWIFIGSQYIPVGSTSVKHSYVLVNSSIAYNNTKVLAWATYSPFEFYQINVTSTTGNPFNTTLTQVFYFETVAFQPEWLSILSFSLMVAGVMGGATYITVRSRREELGRVKKK